MRFGILGYYFFPLKSHHNYFILTLLRENSGIAPLLLLIQSKCVLQKLNPVGCHVSIDLLVS
jgi:hypothetical protein